MNIISRGRIKAAFAIAIGTDVLQIALFPFFAEGIASPLDVALDLVVCVLLTRLVGWHYAFLPGFILEMVPMADLVPTWTLAVLIATRQQPAASAKPSGEPTVQNEREKPPAGAGQVIDVEVSKAEPDSPPR